MTTCRCGATWSGYKPEHCPAVGCHKTFVGTRAGDKHRVGDHNDGTRRCLIEAEMRAIGMEIGDDGLWYIVADRQRLVSRRVLAAQAPAGATDVESDGFGITSPRNASARTSGAALAEDVA